MTSWSRKAGRYVMATLLVVGAACGVGLPFLGPEGRRGFVLAAGVAVAVQWASFGVLARMRTGTPGFLATWAGSTLVRFAIVGVAAYAVVGRDGIDLVVTLLAMVGFFFVLLLLEPWALRETGIRQDERTTPE